MTAQRQPIHVSVAGIPGSLSLPVTGLFEVLSAFPMLCNLYEGVPDTPPFEVEIVACDKTQTTSPAGLTFSVQRAISEIQRTDIVIVPSMAGPDGWDWHTGQHREFVEWMVRMHERGAMLCSACSGVLVLAETGLLDGRRATIHWAFAPAFRRNFPAVTLCVDEALVVAGERDELVMSGATASWQDLVLYLITRLVSAAAAQAMAKFMLLDWHAEGQAPYVPFTGSPDHGDAVVKGLQEWLRTHYTVARPVEEMARRAALSRRTFERRFKRATGYSPIDYVQRLRVEEARRRLERTDTAIDEIGWEVGYEDAAAFRRLFKRVTRLTPGAYRRKFRMPELT